MYFENTYKFLQFLWFIFMDYIFMDYIFMNYFYFLWYLQFLFFYV